MGIVANEKSCQSQRDKMEFDFLKKEEEFYKENEKLEIRTKELMQRVDDVMKIQDNLIKDTFKTKTEISNVRRNNYKFPTISKSSESLVCNGDSVEDLNVPASVNEMGPKGMTHFFRAKLKAAENENGRLQNLLKAKSEEIKRLQKDNQVLVDEKEKWFFASSSSKNTIAKLESQISSVNSRFQAKENENISLKKEVEQLKKEIKNTNLNLHNCEVRLNRAHEENEKLKLALKAAKDEEKELKDSHRKQINELSAHVKHIEKHKAELLNGYKKQLQLIDNLKRQKMNLEALKVAELAETEFMKLLDMKLE